MSISQNFPNTRPSLNLNFARSKTLDPRITFSRTTTGTYVDESGFIRDAAADEPRFDHDPVTGECLGLLIEEQRENLVPYSEDFSQWTLPSSITITSNNIVSPDGTQNADLVSTTTNESGPYVSITASQNTTYTLSVFLKYGNTPTIRLRDLDGGTNPGHHIIFNLLTQTFSSALNLDNYGYIPYLNGWYRVWMTFTTGSYTNLSLQVRSASEVSGDETFYAWGGQIEEGAFPTSYIPTSGSTATRNPDNVSMTGTNFSDWYNPSEGSIYCSAYNVGVTTTTSRFFYAIEDASASSSDFMRQWIWNGNTSLLLNSFYTSNTTGQGSAISAEFSVSLEDVNKKISVGYAQSDFARSYNGSLTTDTSGNLPTGIDRLRIGTNLSGHISQLTYYPVRLPNSTLQTLTK